MRSGSQKPASPRPMAPAPAVASARGPLPQNARRTVLERLTEPTAAPSSTPTATHDGGLDPFNGRSFRLDFVNAAEDIPRVIRAHIKLKQMECGLVLRPHDGQGLLVHSQDGQAWRWTGLDSDIPMRPEEPVAIPEAIRVLRGAQGTLPSQGPITLKGMWSGKISCDRGQPRITLQRKVASYGTLMLWSDAAARLWFWRVERAQKWFTRAGQLEGNAQTLVIAMQQGLASAMGLLGEACSTRDSRRRAAMDSEYAELHPIKPAREGKDPTEKFNPKEPKPPKAPSTRGRKPAATAPAPQPEAAPIPTAARRRSSSAANQPMATPPPAAVADAGEIDPAKDKLLLDAFGDALSMALEKMG